MSKRYIPKHKVFTLRMFTPFGWMRGQLHLPIMARLFNFLDRCGTFLKLTGVQVVGRQEVHKFFALRKNSIEIIIPHPLNAEIVHPSLGGRRVRRVRCYLEYGVVDGDIAILEELRVSDFFIRREEFVYMTDAEITLVTPSGGSDRELVPQLILNPAHVIGVTELED